MFDPDYSYEIIDHTNKIIYLWQGSNADCDLIFSALDHAKKLIETTYNGYKMEREIDGGESDEFTNIF
jgi:hypothetical protein